MDILEKLTLGQLADVYNRAGEKLDQPTVTKFTDRASAIRRTATTLEKAGLVVTLVDDRPILSTPDKAPLSGDDRIIRMVSRANPKRVGTKAHARYELFRDGMTVGQFVKRIGNRREAMLEIRYNTEHGHIKLEVIPPKKS